MDGDDRQPQVADDVSLDGIPLHSTNLLTLLDPSGTIRYESPAIERIFGFDPGEMVGEQVVDYFHPEDSADVVEAFRTVVTSDEYTTESVEYRHERADSTYCWVESVSSSEPTPEGHYVVNTRDISERKAREQELRRQNERLGEFAGVLSHDLRNPLQVAQGRLAVLEGDEAHVAAIERAHTRMETLIETLLTLANDGETIVDPEPVALQSVVEDCWETVRTDGATLVTDTDRTVRADRSRLRQLLENLVRNSVEHATRGATGESGDGVTVVVGDLPGGFYVADDGPGIQPDERDRVFEMGYSKGNGGTGVGLSIVRQVSRAHGWTHAVTDSDAGGARFEFTGIATVDSE
jgi:PAS domain S-box-containing protein